jgi:hypothetical protein
MDVEITPRKEALRSLGATEMEFDAALEAALEKLADKPRRELPGARDIPIWLLNREHRLGELAAIHVEL